MRDKVLHFFQNLPKTHEEQFNVGFELYRKSDGKSLATERVLNAGGFTKLNLENLLYDLQKMHGIKEHEKFPKKLPEIPEVERVKKAVLESGNSDLLLLSLTAYHAFKDFSDFSDCSQEFIEWVEKMNSMIPDFIQNKSEELGLKIGVSVNDLYVAMEDELVVVQLPDFASEKLKSLETKGDDDVTNNLDPEVVNQTESKSENLKFRDEYPFLKDSDCPDELKILATDKITHYEKYTEAHDKLAKAESGEVELSEEEKNDLAALSVFHFEENKAIKDELDYYKEKKEVLGNHPVFKMLKAKREVEGMTQDELIKFHKNTPSFISKNKTKLAAASSEERKANLLKAKEERELLFTLVKEKLGISGD